MEQLTFNHGRTTFCRESFEMVPSLPDFVELRIQVYYINEYGFMKAAFTGFDAIEELRRDEKCVWLHLSGSLQEDFWKELKGFADLNDEQLKSLKNPHQRSFIEEYESGLFWSVFRPFVSDQFDGLEVVNFYMGDRVLLTRQFSHDEAFSNIEHRLFAKGEMIASYGVDRLAADLLENVIHSYYECLTIGGAKLEQLQTRIIKHPGKEELHLINRAQQLVWIFLKSVWPLETITQVLARSKSPIISAEGKTEFSYCQDEASSILRLFETYREMSYDIMDVYVSGLGLRTNEATKVLTIIATLFLPPTLIAGIYGMNFQIPEIQLPLGYYVCLGSMFVVSFGLLAWLKRKGYIEF